MIPGIDVNFETLSNSLMNLIPEDGIELHRFINIVKPLVNQSHVDEIIDILEEIKVITVFRYHGVTPVVFRRVYND